MSDESTEPKHEAPAEGAGEDDLTLRGLATLINGYARDRDREGLPQTAETLRHAALIIDHYRELRARSSAPEAREGDQPGIVKAICQHCQRATIVPAETLALVLYTAPSADKLREAYNKGFADGEQSATDFPRGEQS